MNRRERRKEQKKGIVQVGYLNPNPYEGWGADANTDANRIHAWTNGKTQKLLGFHLTTPDRAEEILLNGPRISEEQKIGFNGRPSPAGFWLNNVPFLPYSIEQFMPNFLEGEDMAILGFMVPFELMDTFVIETTWPFTQWPIDQQTIDQSQPRIIEPKEFIEYRSDLALNRLSEYIAEERYWPEGGYPDQLKEVIDEKIKAGDIKTLSE